MHHLAKAGAITGGTRFADRRRVLALALGFLMVASTAPAQAQVVDELPTPGEVEIDRPMSQTSLGLFLVINLGVVGAELQRGPLYLFASGTLGYPAASNG